MKTHKASEEQRQRGKLQQRYNSSDDEPRHVGVVREIAVSPVGNTAQASCDTPHRARGEDGLRISLVCADLLINEHIDICGATVHAEHPPKAARFDIHPSAWKGNSQKFVLRLGYF